MQLLDVIVNPFPGGSSVGYFQKLSGSLTVPAGTFDDVLIFMNLATFLGPNHANTLFGLDESIPYGVTHVWWYAAGIGEIQNRDYAPTSEAEMLFEYQLKATSVPLPPSLLLLGSGLLGLLALRGRFPQ